MISYIKGELTEVLTDIVVLESGQMGFEIRVPGSILSMLPPAGTQMKLYTYMQVREDAVNLFGFLTRDDLDIFKLLLGVNGVGPRAALGILSILSADDLRFAVLSGDVKAISRAPGIGNKTAQKLILELKDKLKLEDAFAKKQENLQSNIASPALGGNVKQEAVLALTALGYSNSEALKAVSKITITEDSQVEEVLKAALKHMAF